MNFSKRMLSFYNNSKLAHDEHFKFSQTWTIFEPWTIFEDLRIKRIKTSIQPTIHPLHGSQCPFPNSSPPLGAWERPNVDQIFSKCLVGPKNNLYCHQLSQEKTTTFVICYLIVYTVTSNININIIFNYLKQCSVSSCLTLSCRWVDMDPAP